MFGALKVIGKLKDFLTDRNLELLDVVLRGLTDPTQASFKTFWTWFKSVRPGDGSYAVGKLEELRNILKEYRGV